MNTEWYPLFQSNFLEVIFFCLNPRFFIKQWFKCFNIPYTYYINGAKDMAVVVAGLQVLGDIGKCTEILWVLSSTGDVPDFVLSNNILAT